METHYGCNRAKDLIAEHGHVAGDVCEDGGLVKTASQRVLAATEGDLRPGVDRGLHQRIDIVDGRGIDQRTDFDVLGEAIAYG